MTDLVKRLRDWEHVHPEDQDKPEGHLYEEAADRIEELQSRLRWVITERDDNAVGLDLMRPNHIAQQIENAYKEGPSDAPGDMSPGLADVDESWGESIAKIMSDQYRQIEQIEEWFEEYEAKVERLREAHTAQKHYVEELFALLDKTEETDDGRVFHPTTIRSCRAADAEKLETILANLKDTIAQTSTKEGERDD